MLPGHADRSFGNVFKIAPSVAPRSGPRLLIIAPFSSQPVQLMKRKARATVVCARGDRLLLVSRDGIRWALPGGRPGKNETYADAAVRELQEETALQAKGIGFLFQVIGATTVHHVFVANIRKSASAKPSKEIHRCQWFSTEELAEVIVSATTRRIVDDFWKGQEA